MGFNAQLLIRAQLRERVLNDELYFDIATLLPSDLSANMLSLYISGQYLSFSLGFYGQY